MHTIKIGDDYKMNLTILSVAGIAMVVLIFVIAIGGELVGTLQSTQTPASVPYNISSKGLDALAVFGDWFVIIVVAIIGIVIIGILGYYRFKQA